MDPGRLSVDDLRTHAPGQGHFRTEAAAALWTRGVGRNGKDTLRNLMGSILGSYAVTIDASTFSKIRDPNAPSPVYALCRARRFVSLWEVDGRLQVYKKFTDPISELSGRDLYENIVRYKPQFLAFFAANEPPPLVSDYAVRQRTAMHISVFTDNPVEANQKTWVPVEDTIRSTFFAILHMVYKHLLKDRPMRSIGPTPTKCLALLGRGGRLGEVLPVHQDGDPRGLRVLHQSDPAGARGGAAGQASEAQRPRPAEECGRGERRSKAEDQRPLLDVQIRGRRGEEGLERQLHPPREVRGAPHSFRPAKAKGHCTVCPIEHRDEKKNIPRLHLFPTLPDLFFEFFLALGLYQAMPQLAGTQRHAQPAEGPPDLRHGSDT